MPKIVKYAPMGELLWKRQKTGYLFIEEPVLNVISSYRQTRASDTEAGGLLSGYYKGDHLHITNLTVPQPRDIRGRYSFKRRDLKHVKTVTHWYQKSSGQINCLGEWHTHPESNPSPSTTDINSWQRINSTRRDQEAIFLIAGIQCIWAGECF